MTILVVVVLLAYVGGRKNRDGTKRDVWGFPIITRFRMKGTRSRPFRIRNGGETWASLYSKVGSRSKFAGIVFAGLTSVLLVLSFLTQYIVFEIDSILAFLVSIVLLFSDPRRRVQSPVMDAILDSSGRSIQELAVKQSEQYEYLPAAKGVSGVVLVPVMASNGILKIDGSEASYVTPPGRALAELFVKVVGLPYPSINSLEASLPRVVTENFGLARSMRLFRNGDSVTMSLGSPSFKCPCGEGRVERKGVAGCPVASFLAVLVCAAEGRPLILSECSRDSAADTWQVSMGIATVGPEV